MIGWTGIGPVEIEAGSTDDGIGDLLGRELIGAQGNVRCSVERQAALVARGEVGVIGENGTRVFGSAAAGERGVEFDLEMHEQGTGGIEKGARVFALDGATAESQHQSVGGREPGDGCVFAIAEGGFAVAGEDFGDGGAGFGFNDVVDVDELPAEARGKNGTDGGFAGAHEAGENDTAGRRCLISQYQKEGFQSRRGPTYRLNYLLSVTWRTSQQNFLVVELERGFFYVVSGSSSLSGG
jgi:hypothetical protein